MAYSIEDERVVRCPPEVLLERILDPGAWPAWQPEIDSTDRSGRMAEGDIVRGRARMLGFHVEGQSAAVEVGQGFFEEDVLVGVRMRVRYEVRPHERGAVVTQRMVVDMPKGLSGRVLSVLLRWRLRRMQRTALAKLASQAETEPSA